MDIDRKNASPLLAKSRERRVKILYKDANKSTYKAINGEIVSVRRNGKADVLILEDRGKEGRKQALVEVSGEVSFSFLPCGVSAKSPIFYPARGVAVTEEGDERTYEEIAAAIGNRHLKTETERIEGERETSFSSVGKLPWHRCPTFLSVFGNVNLWEAGFRGFPIEEKQHFDLYDYFVPRKNWDRLDFGEDAKRVVYRYSMGRGMGAYDPLSRRNYKGIYPCLTAKIKDGGIEYRLTAFCDGKNGAERDEGTDYRNAVYHSAANALDEREIADAKAREGEDTILRVRIEAVNTGNVSAEAYLRLPQIDTPVMAEADAVNERIENGFGFYGDKVYMRASVNGEKASGAEIAFLLPPKEKARVNVILFHSPADRESAEAFNENDFDFALKKAETFWRKNLGDVYFWKLPEKRIEEALKTGCFHLMESCFGKRESETFAPCVGVYPPIGSESSPVVRFLTDCGKTELAGKCMNFFFDREKENGFIQNICGYMLENGATLYNEGVYFASSGKKEQLARNFGKIEKATEYVLSWIERNKNEKTCGYGMIDGQVADPEDTYRSYALNAFAYAGLKSAAFLYSACGKNGGAIDARAEELKENIRSAFRESMKKAPLIPLKNGTWVPAVAPWAEGRGACFLHLDGSDCFSHAGHILKDSLLGLHFLVWFGVFDRDSEEGRMIADTMADVYCHENTAFSQPYYNLVPLIDLFAGRRKAFLREYYTAFATLADRETYSFWEHYFLATPHKTHEQAWFLMRTRHMLYREEKGALYLLSGIPDAWRKNGKEIVLKNAVCLYGKFSLSVRFTKGKPDVRFCGEFSDIPVYIAINGENVRVV